MQCDQAPQQRGTQEAAASVRVRLPVHEHLPAPESRARDFLVIADVGRQHCVGIDQRRVDEI